MKVILPEVLDLFEYDGFYGVIPKEKFFFEYSTPKNRGRRLYLTYYTKGRYTGVPLSRLIYYLVHKGNFNQKMDIDHIDRNIYNNSIENLRQVTKSQNQCNRSIPKNNKTGFRGVCKYVNTDKCKRLKTWKASIGVNGKSISLGYFNTDVEAARAYNEASIKYHGEFANLNDIPS